MACFLPDSNMPLFIFHSVHVLNNAFAKAASRATPLRCRLLRFHRHLCGIVIACLSVLLASTELRIEARGRAAGWRAPEKTRRCKVPRRELPASADTSFVVEQRQTH